MDGGKVIANDTPRNIGKRLWEKKNDMFTAMPTPVRVFYGSGGRGVPSDRAGGQKLAQRYFPEPAGKSPSFRHSHRPKKTAKSPFH